MICMALLLGVWWYCDMYGFVAMFTYYLDPISHFLFLLFSSSFSFLTFFSLRILMEYCLCLSISLLIHYSLVFVPVVRRQPLLSLFSRRHFY